MALAACAFPTPGPSVSTAPEAIAATSPPPSEASISPAPKPSRLRPKTSARVLPDPGETIPFTDLRDYAFDPEGQLVALDGSRLVRLSRDGQRTPFGPSEWDAEGASRCEPKALFRSPDGRWVVIASLPPGAREPWRDQMFRLGGNEDQVESVSSLAGRFGPHVTRPDGAVVFSLAKPNPDESGNSSDEDLKYLVGLYSLEPDRPPTTPREIAPMGLRIRADAALASQRYELVVEGHAPNVSNYLKPDGSLEPFGRISVPLAFDGEGLAYSSYWSDEAPEHVGLKRATFKSEREFANDAEVIVGPGGRAFTDPTPGATPFEADLVRFAPNGDLYFRASKRALGRVPVAALARRNDSGRSM